MRNIDKKKFLNTKNQRENPHINMTTNVRHWNSEFQGRKQNKEVAKNFEVVKKVTKKKASAKKSEE